MWTRGSFIQGEEQKVIFLPKNGDKRFPLIVCPLLLLPRSSARHIFSLAKCHVSKASRHVNGHHKKKEGEEGNVLRILSCHAKEFALPARCLSSNARWSHGDNNIGPAERCCWHCSLSVWSKIRAATPSLSLTADTCA